MTTKEQHREAMAEARRHAKANAAWNAALCGDDQQGAVLASWVWVMEEMQMAGWADGR